MDFAAIEGNLPLLLVIVALILLPLFFGRKRRSEARPQEIVRVLLSEVRLNLSQTEMYRSGRQVKKFEAVSWGMHKGKLDFLSQSLQAALSDAFMMVEDYNQQIDAAKKHRSAGSLASINADKLKGSLTKSKEGLEEWLMSKVGTKEPPTKYPGLFDGLFGGR